MNSDVILVIVVATALAFDFTNGFHDTANVAATAISTRAVAPRPAVAVAALLNFVGAFISLKVAATVGQGFVDIHAVTMTVVFAGLIGAIGWNLLTWWFGLPSSSSHALIGGLVGAVWAADGWQEVSGQGLLDKLIVPAVVAPIVAFGVAGLSILIVYRIVGRLRPGPVNRGFRLGQLASGGLLALSHGTNDAQKTMGLITLALVAHGSVSASHFQVPAWVVLASATRDRAGHVQRRLADHPHDGQPDHQDGSGAGLRRAECRRGGDPRRHERRLPALDHARGGGRHHGCRGRQAFSAVRWGVAGNIVAAWVLTLPAAGASGAAVYGLTTLFGRGVTGPIVISAVLLSVLAVVFVRRQMQSSPAPAPS